MEPTELIANITQAMTVLDGEKAETSVKEALKAGLDPVKVLQEGVLNALGVIGQKFETKEYFLAELILAGEIGKKCVSLISPHLPKAEGISAGRVVIATVKDDIHDIGKNLVVSQLRVHGFEVHDLGVDVPSMAIIDKAQEVSADIIGVGAFLYSTMGACKEVINYLTDMGTRDKYKVIIGGCITTREYADSIGADGWAANAIEAVSLCKRLLT